MVHKCSRTPVVFTSIIGEMTHSSAGKKVMNLVKSVWFVMQNVPGEPCGMERETSEFGAWRILGSPRETVKCSFL